MLVSNLLNALIVDAVKGSLSPLHYLFMCNFTLIYVLMLPQDIISDCVCVCVYVRVCLSVCVCPLCVSSVASGSVGCNALSSMLPRLPSSINSHPLSQAVPFTSKKLQLLSVLVNCTPSIPSLSWYLPLSWKYLLLFHDRALP